MPGNRIGRINEETQRELSALIRQLKDPRVNTAGMVSVTRVDTTADLRYAKIYISVLENDKRDGLMAALKNAKGYIRRALGKRMIIRHTPELIFVSDKNIEYGVHIAKVLADTVKPEKNAGEGVQDGSEAEES